MLRIAVCDDSEVSSAELVTGIKELATEMSLDVCIDVFRSFKTLYKTLQSERYGMLLLEAGIGDVNGIEFARMLRQMGYDGDIVFCTSTKDYAYEAFSAFPTGYLLKPVPKTKLKDVLRHITERHRKQPAISVRNADGEKITVNISQISYIEVYRTELEVHCGSNVITCVGSPTEVLRQLPESEFYRSHRSYIVNLGFVTKMSKYAFTMQNGDKVTIAKNRYAEAKAKFDKFAGNI
jgi:DNA-binding LytR/AlgR family response regulator